MIRRRIDGYAPTSSRLTILSRRRRSCLRASIRRSHPRQPAPQFRSVPSRCSTASRTTVFLAESISSKPSPTAQRSSHCHLSAPWATQPRVSANTTCTTTRSMRATRTGLARLQPWEGISTRWVQRAHAIRKMSLRARLATSVASMATWAAAFTKLASWITTCRFRALTERASRTGHHWPRLLLFSLPPLSPFACLLLDRPAAAGGTSVPEGALITAEALLRCL